MTATLIVSCSRCGRMLLAKADQKTRGCPHCGYTIQLQKARRLGSANTANEASILLRKLKTEAAANERGFQIS